MRVSGPEIADCVICFKYIHTQVVKHAAHWVQAIRTVFRVLRVLTVCSVSNICTSDIYTFRHTHIQVVKHAAHWMQVIRRECLGLKSLRLPGLPSMPLLHMVRQASSICTRPRKLCCLLTSFLSLVFVLIECCLAAYHIQVTQHLLHQSLLELHALLRWSLLYSC